MGKLLKMLHLVVTLAAHMPHYSRSKSLGGEIYTLMAIESMDVLDKILAASKNTLAEALGIEILSATAEGVRGSMPVDQRTKQPAGLLHGGASLALAETLASIAGMLRVAEAGIQVVGQEINANHLRPVKDGVVYGEAKPIHIGRTSHVWEIRISDERKRLVCISRCTLRVVPRREFVRDKSKGV